MLFKQTFGLNVQYNFTKFSIFQSYLQREENVQRATKRQSVTEEMKKNGKFRDIRSILD